jgi:hypothetical protein
VAVMWSSVVLIVSQGADTCKVSGRCPVGVCSCRVAELVRGWGTRL